MVVGGGALPYNGNWGGLFSVRVSTLTRLAMRNVLYKNPFCLLKVGWTLAVSGSNASPTTPSESNCWLRLSYSGVDPTNGPCTNHSFSRVLKGYVQPAGLKTQLLDRVKTLSVKGPDVLKMKLSAPLKNGP